MGNKIMIWIVVGILLVASFLIVKKAKSNVSGEVINEEEIENLYEATLAIEGMSCEGCAYGVKTQFEGLDGVVSADVDYRDGSGVVKYDADKVNAETIAAASTTYSAVVISDQPLSQRA